MQRTVDDLSPEIKAMLVSYEEEKKYNESRGMSAEYKRFSERCAQHHDYYKDPFLDNDEKNGLLEMLLQERKEMFNEDNQTLELMRQNTKRIYNF